MLIGLRDKEEAKSTSIPRCIQGLRFTFWHGRNGQPERGPEGGANGRKGQPESDPKDPFLTYYWP